MRTKSVSYWMNKLESNSKYEAKDESEYSYQQIGEYYLSCKKKEKVAA